MTGRTFTGSTTPLSDPQLPFVAGRVASEGRLNVAEVHHSNLTDVTVQDHSGAHLAQSRSKPEAVVTQTILLFHSASFLISSAFLNPEGNSGFPRRLHAGRPPELPCQTSKCWKFWGSKYQQPLMPSLRCFPANMVL